MIRAFTVSVVVDIDGEDAVRTFRQREARQKGLKYCRACRTKIRIGQTYWELYTNWRYHDVCFRETFPETLREASQ